MQDPRLDLAAFALAHAPDVLAVLDPDGNLAWLGGATAKVGPELDHALGRPLLDFVHPDDVVQALGALAEASSKPGFHQAAVIRMRRDDDRLVRLRVTATTVAGPDGDWLVLSGRGEDDDVALELRRRELDAAVARVSEVCAGVRWYELHELVPASLDQVASIVGADRIELVTTTDGREGEAEVALAWAAHDEITLSPTRFVADPEDLRTQPCVRNELGDGGPEIAEIWYRAAHGGSGVVRMHFPASYMKWEDANSDHIRALGSVLASTAHRCREEEQSHHHATRDSLTGLLNRRGLLRETATWEDTESLDPVAVVFVDLNGFKAVNDSLGHGTGDDVLRAAGDALCQAVRADDLVARLGGDEFVIVIPAAREDAGALAARIRGALDSVGDRWPGISAAVGVSIGGPDGDVAVEDLIARADAAMYADKRAQSGVTRPATTTPPDDRGAAGATQRWQRERARSVRRSSR